MGKKSGGRVRVKQVGPKKVPKNLGNPLEDLMGEESGFQNLLMSASMPKPNKNAVVVWPMAETFTMDYSNFQVIYPNYMDSTKTIKMGRRLGKASCVDTPTVADLSGALQSLQIRHVIQPHKGYSRDMESQWDNPGRVLVEIVKGGDDDDSVQEMGPDGTFDISGSSNKENSPSSWTKQSLLRELAARIHHLPSRKERLEMEARQQKEAEEQRARQQAAAAAAAKKTAATASASTSNKKKKGKKKR